jgi:hypothetical protein
MASLTLRMSSDRPANDVGCSGKFPGITSTERSDVNCELSPGAATW